MAAQAALDGGLIERERLAGGDENLLAHEIDPRDHLGDRVLDLDARVHLEEEELVAGDEVLDRPDAVVADRSAPRRCRQRASRRATRGDIRRRRLFPELLMAPLQRAVALADVQHVAVLVGQDLQLDVLGVVEITFGVDRRVAEVGRRLALRVSRTPTRSRRACARP